MPGHDKCQEKQGSRKNMEGLPLRPLSGNEKEENHNPQGKSDPNKAFAHHGAGHSRMEQQRRAQGVIVVQIPFYESVHGQRDKKHKPDIVQGFARKKERPRTQSRTRTGNHRRTRIG